MVFALSSETDHLFLLSDAKNFEAVSERVHFVSLRVGFDGWMWCESKSISPEMNPLNLLQNMTFSAWC